MTAPFDPGLQPERTELAWRRTALAIGVGSLVALRLLPVALGDPWWALAGVVGLLVAAAIWLVGRRRLHAVNAMLARVGDRGRMPGGGPLAAIAVFVVTVGAFSLAVLLVL